VKVEYGKHRLLLHPEVIVQMEILANHPVHNDPEIFLVY